MYAVQYTIAVTCCNASALHKMSLVTSYIAQFVPSYYWYLEIVTVVWLKQYYEICSEVCPLCTFFIQAIFYHLPKLIEH